MNLLLAKNIFGKPWFIEPSFAMSMYPYLANGIDFPKEIIEESKIYATSNGGKTNATIDNATKGSIAVIDIKGALMKNDQMCGPVGMQTIGSWIEQADSNPNIDGIVLKIDSPGGTIDGTEELASIVKGTKKPIVALVDGTMASAAYFIGSSADSIILKGESSQVGSIGCMIGIKDVQPLLESAGVKFHEVYATDSIDKNADFRKALAGDYSGLIQNRLDPVNKIFTSSVSKNRKGKINIDNENVLTGKVYFSKQAIKVGLADSIGTMADAIAFIKNNSKTSKTKTMATTATNNRTHLNALLTATADHAETEEGVFLQSVELDTIETALSNASVTATELATLTEANTSIAKELETATTLATSLQEKLTKAETDLATANARITALESEEGATATNVKANNSVEQSNPQKTVVLLGDEAEKERIKARYAFAHKQ